MIYINFTDHIHIVSTVETICSCFILVGTYPVRDQLPKSSVITYYKSGETPLLTQQMVQQKRYSDAARTIGPLAYSPHPGERTNEARKLLQDVEARLEQSQRPPPDAPAAE